MYMKKLILSAIALIAASTFTSCNAPAEPAAPAEVNVSEVVAGNE